MLTENQVAEVECLQAIFADSDIHIDNNSVILLLVPDPTRPQNDPENKVALKIQVQLPPGYPETESPSVFPVYKQNIDETRWSALSMIIDQVIESNAGFEILFDLFSQLTSWLQDNNEPLLSMFDTLNKAEEEVVDVEESCEDSDENRPTQLEDKNLVPEDHRVTEEQFMLWRDKFRQEMISHDIWQDDTVDDTKLTGRQFFLRSQNTDVVWGDKTLFEEGDDFEEFDQLDA